MQSDIGSSATLSKSTLIPSLSVPVDSDICHFVFADHVRAAFIQLFSNAHSDRLVIP